MPITSRDVERKEPNVASGTDITDDRDRYIYSNTVKDLGQGATLPELKHRLAWLDQSLDKAYERGENVSAYQGETLTDQLWQKVENTNTEILHRFPDSKEAQRIAADRAVAPPVEQALKPASLLSNEQIVTEVRELHSHFKELSAQYNGAPAAQRTNLREEMQPLVDRERELRQEYKVRASQELSVDRAPDQIGYGR